MARNVYANPISSYLSGYAMADEMINRNKRLQSDLRTAELNRMLNQQSYDYNKETNPFRINALRRTDALGEWSMGNTNALPENAPLRRTAEMSLRNDEIKSFSDQLDFALKESAATGQMNGLVEFFAARGIQATPNPDGLVLTDSNGNSALVRYNELDVRNPLIQELAVQRAMVGARVNPPSGAGGLGNVLPLMFGGSVGGAPAPAAAPAAAPDMPGSGVSSGAGAPSTPLNAPLDPMAMYEDQKALEDKIERLQAAKEQLEATPRNSYFGRVFNTVAGAFNPGFNLSGDFKSMRRNMLANQLDTQLDVLQNMYADRGYAKVGPPRYAMPAGAASNQNNIGGFTPEMLRQAITKVESAGDPNAVSPKGAVGLMQVRPSTAMDPGYGVPNIFDFAESMGVNVPSRNETTAAALLRDPLINQEYGMAYMSALLEKFGDLDTALAAYNMGPSATVRHLQKYGQLVPELLNEETRNYIPRVRAALAAYQ